MVCLFLPPALALAAVVVVMAFDGGRTGREGRDMLLVLWLPLFRSLIDLATETEEGGHRFVWWSCFLRYGEEVTIYER